MATLGLLGSLLAHPMHTVCCTPLTSTVEITGEGGNPPPTNSLERSPPHVALPAMIAPEAFRRFTRYPRASPSGFAHTSVPVGHARFVLNATTPPKIIAEVTVCSPLAGHNALEALRSMTHDFFVEIG